MTERTPKWVRVTLPIAVVVTAIVVFAVLKATKPQPPRQDKPLEGVLVETMRVTQEQHDVSLRAKGVVLAAKQVVLQPDLGGRVVWQSSELVPGGRFKKGKAMVRIDARDYQIAVERSLSEVNRVQLELDLERRRADVAKKEWEAFGDDQAGEAGRALALREPQLENAQVALRATKAALKKSRLDLNRTTLHAPFNAMVVNEGVDVGQLISPQTSVATLVGTDQFWVQVSIPVGSLTRIRVRQGDTPGSEAKVSQQTGQGTVQRVGEVVRQLPDLDPGGAMARVLVTIKNPLESKVPLLLGTFVDVEVEAGVIENAFRIPRSAIHDGTRVYVMGADDRLEIREVGIAWTQPDAVLVTSGIASEDRLITSRITTAVPRMLLRTRPNSDSPLQAEAHGATAK